MVYTGVIQGKSVYLKSAQMCDLEFTYEIRQDRERTKYMHQVNKGLETQRKWLEKQLMRPGDIFLIVYDKAGERIGTNSIYHIDGENATGEIGRTILNGNPIQNLEANVLSYEFAFYELGLEVLYAEVMQGNNAALGVIVRHGGEEIRREYSNELDCEMIYFEIRKKEYDKKRDGLLKLVNRFAGRDK